VPVTKGVTVPTPLLQVEQGVAGTVMTTVDNAPPGPQPQMVVMGTMGMVGMTEEAQPQ
jgi:hypothetical protein